MLILTGKPGETIHIGEVITVAVLGMQGNEFRIGIQAPDDVTILREELLHREQAPPSTS